MNFKPSSPRLKPVETGTERQPARQASHEQAPTESVPPENLPDDASGPIRPQSVADDDSGRELADEELRIDDAMRGDRFRLKRDRKRLSADEFKIRLAKSVLRRRRRDAYTAKLDYPSELPITQYKDEIVELIRSRQVIIVCGETGSGKSTQLPKFCLEAGLGRQATIGHTQPRRLAARSIATRLADELGCRLGEQVGYQVRFGDQTGPDTLIKLMTDGILLAETGSDRFLDQYDALIIDEAHERSLNIDFLLAFLCRLRGKRPDLKIIITSATIDAQRFADHFADETGPAPVLNVEGRGYPVETRYLPWEDVVDDDNRSYDLSHHVLAGLKNLARSGSGDTLIFLPTERDIRLVSHRVAGHYRRMGLENRVEILPLYARLPQKDQQRIFQTGGQKQRLIFATNVAESSLTVPGIRYVIDSGTARISRYSPRSKLQRLPIEPVSQASANQRSGRCGRVGPGICVRLFSSADFESREPYTTPEIRRTNLASVVLQSKMLGFGSLEDLPLLDVPRGESIREGIQTLIELGAIADDQELTDTGRALGRMPVDPRIGRIILEASRNGVLAEILPIAAALETADPRVRPQDKQQAADEAHAEFQDGESDFLSLLRLWRYYEQARCDLSRGKLTRELRKRFLSPTRMREWSDTYRQLREIATQVDPERRRGGKGKRDKASGKLGAIRYADDQSKATVDKDRYALIHQALLSGFLSGVAMAGDQNAYLGPRNLKLYLWPGSGVFAQKPKWIVAAELVETSKQFARTVARIQPQWIEQVGGHLLKSSYSDPHWSRKANGPFCYQRQSLFGLPVVVKRRVPLPPIDPQTARDLLIRHGLVERQLQTSARFVRFNRQLRDSLEQLAAKTRRRELVVDDYVISQFYSNRLPDEVCDKGRLERFAKSHPVPPWCEQLADAASLSNWLQDPPTTPNDSESCFMLPGDLVDASSDTISEESFPDALVVGSTELPLRYRYEPGAEDDGVSVRIHQAAVSQVSDDRLGWLVPGLLHGKIVAMIKSLPKRIRRNLVPAADVARQICDELMPDYAQVPFMSAVCQSMSRHAEMPVRESDFQQEKMDDHLRFLISVVDDEGEVVATGRELQPLVSQILPTATSGESTPPGSDDVLSDQPMRGFDIDVIPEEVIRDRGGVRIAMFPALVDRGDEVVLSLFPDRSAAQANQQRGLTRLYAIAERAELRRQVKWLPGLADAKIRLSGAVGSAQVESALMELLARIAFVESQDAVRTRDAFEARRVDRGERIARAVQEVAGWLDAFADAFLKARGATETLPSGPSDEIQQDLADQIRWLTFDGFLAATPWCWLKHYPRYFAAISYRVDKLTAGARGRDVESSAIVKNLWEQWLAGFAESERTPPRRAADEFRWMVEELRVSLFAQPLGTSIKVSPVRCEKWLSKNSA